MELRTGKVHWSEPGLKAGSVTLAGEELLRLAEQKAATHKAGRAWPSTWDTFLKPVQYSVKLIRWLRTCITSRLTWTAALPRLQALYAVL